MSEQLDTPVIALRSNQHRWFQVGIVMAVHDSAGASSKTVVVFVINDVDNEVEAGGLAVAHALDNYPPSVIQCVRCRDITDVMAVAPDPEDDEGRQTLWACAVAFIPIGGGAQQLYLTTVRTCSRLLARGMASAESMLDTHRRAIPGQAIDIQVTGVAAINADAVAAGGLDEDDADVGDQAINTLAAPAIALSPARSEARNLILLFNLMALGLAVMTWCGVITPFVFSWLVLVPAGFVVSIELALMARRSRRVRRLFRIA